jgi:hypothetical protein
VSPYFKNGEEVDLVIGGFLRIFPRLDPLLREITGQILLLLKLELSKPELLAEIDFTKNPLEVRFGTGTDGTVGMACTADDFHLVLLGLLPIGTGVNHARLLMRGSTARMMDVVPLFYVAPAVYPFYLESIGRADLIIEQDRPPLHGRRDPEDAMTKIVSVLAYTAGYALGLIKSNIAPRLDIVTALEAMGKGLLKSGLPKKAQAQEK